MMTGEGYVVIHGPLAGVGPQFHEAVPFSEAQPSPDGEFWRCQRPNGSRRCFFAPPPSTNFYLTTAGAFRTQALIDTLLEVGSDRVLFSVDYPYETMQEQSDWFESVPISEDDRLKIDRANTQQLLRLGP